MNVNSETSKVDYTKFKILIVEDQTFISIITQQSLLSTGTRISRYANSAKQAIKILNNEKSDR